MDINMAVPENFPYRDVLRKGMPVHERTDAFRIRHPRMDVQRRAKIFAPFDALKGFNDALAASRQLQEERMAPETVTAEETGDGDVYSVLY